MPTDSSHDSTSMSDVYQFSVYGAWYDSAVTDMARAVLSVHMHRAWICKQSRPFVVFSLQNQSL